MAAAIAQIERVNPAVNALVTVADPDELMRGAAEADARRARGEPLGALHGLPMAIKDTHETRGMRTTWGSPLFADHVPPADAPIVRRVKDAGALIVGKSNVPEFGAGSHTFNTLFGVTRNPYDLARSAGGSSGGSAAALACGLVPLADGSDLGGSLRNPASFCSVVGLRPSAGRIPDVTTPPWSHAVTGPMGRTVRDVALLLSVQAGEGPPSLAPLGASSQLRIAWSEGFGLPFEPAVTNTAQAVRAVMQSAGWRVHAAEPDLTGADEAFQTLRARLLATELGAAYRQNPDSFKPTLRWNIEKGLALQPGEIVRAERLTDGVRHAFAAFMADVDVLAVPTVQVRPFPIELEYPSEIAGVPMETYVDWMRSCSWISVTGAPALSLPLGMDEGGLPVGIQLIGRPGRDLDLLAAAERLEREIEPWGWPACAS